MKKTFVAFVAVAAIAASFATPASAQRGLGAAVAGGIIGGAIVGSAIAANPPPPPPYAYYPAPGPAYVEAAPPPGCRFVRERFWDGYEWRFRHVEVCD